MLTEQDKANFMPKNKQQQIIHLTIKIKKH